MAARAAAGRRPAGAARRAVRVFVTGERSAEAGWRELPSWPPPGTGERRLWLGAAGTACRTTRAGRRARGADRYRYDPSRPDAVARWAGPALARARGRQPRARSARRTCSRTRPRRCRRSLEAIGPVRVELWVRASSPYFDMFARVCDVDPAGRLVERVRRARARRARRASSSRPTGRGASRSTCGRSVTASPPATASAFRSPRAPTRATRATPAPARTRSPRPSCARSRSRCSTTCSTPRCSCCPAAPSRGPIRTQRRPPPPNRFSSSRKTLKTSRKMLAAMGTALPMFASAQAVEVEDREAAEDHEPEHAVDDVEWGIETKMATIPKTIRASSAKNRTRPHADRSRLVA